MIRINQKVIINKLGLKTLNDSKTKLKKIKNLEIK